MPDIIVNGKNIAIGAATTLAALASDFGLIRGGVIVEIDGEAVSPDCDWSGVEIRPGTQVNFFRIVAGG